MPGTRTNVSPTTLLLFDGVTEKVTAVFVIRIQRLEFQIHLMHNSSEGELKNCVRRHIQIVSNQTDMSVYMDVFQFMEEKGPGLASLLYSIVMSKGIDL